MVFYVNIWAGMESNNTISWSVIYVSTAQYWPISAVKNTDLHRRFRIQNTEYRIQNLYCHPWSYSFDHRGYRQIKSLHNYMAQYSSNMNVIRMSPVYQCLHYTFSELRSPISKNIDTLQANQQCINVQCTTLTTFLSIFAIRVHLSFQSWCYILPVKMCHIGVFLLTDRIS